VIMRGPIQVAELERFTILQSKCFKITRRSETHTDCKKAICEERDRTVNAGSRSLWHKGRKIDHIKWRLLCLLSGGAYSKNYSQNKNRLLDLEFPF